MSANVLVSNLNASVTASLLEDMFSIVGNVIRAEVQLNTSGVSSGFAVVEMSSPEEAKNCVLHFDGQRKEGTTLVVREERAHVPKAAVSTSVTRQPAFKSTLRSVRRLMKKSK